MMIDTPVEAILAFVFLSLALFFITRDFYAVWFRYENFQSKVIKNHIRFNGSFARSKGYFADVSRHWILQPGFKWFARIMFALIFLGFCGAWVSLIIYVTLWI